MTSLAELQELDSSEQSNVLEELPRKDLQALAKECGVKANAKSKDIMKSILEYLSQTDSYQSAAAAEYGSKQGEQSLGDEGGALPAPGICARPKQAPLGGPEEISISVQPEAAPSHIKAAGCQPAGGSSSGPEAESAAAQQVGPGSPPGGATAADMQAEIPAADPDAVMECGVKQDEAAARPAVTLAEGVAAEGALPRGEEDEAMLGAEACEAQAAGKWHEEAVLHSRRLCLPAAVGPQRATPKHASQVFRTVHLAQWPWVPAAVEWAPPNGPA